MAVGASEFLARYPEFTKAQTIAPGLIDACLTEAATLTDATVWGDKQSIGIMLRAADMLARSPFARDMKLVSKDDETVYSIRLRDLKRSVAGGYRVA